VGGYLGNLGGKNWEEKLVHGFFLCLLERWKRGEGATVPRKMWESEENLQLEGMGEGTLAGAEPWREAVGEGGPGGGT